MKNTQGTPPSLLFLYIFIALLLGALIGWLAQQYYRRQSYSSSLLSVMELVRHRYVDTVDMYELSESLIPELLHSLDPHSDYIPREESEQEIQRLEGHFYGVGITFNTLIDTPVVVDVIKGGPASRAGLLPGDRLLAADEEALIGDSVANEAVQKILRGEQGSVVKVKVRRGEELREIGITRDDVPIASINVAFMLDAVTGLIQINKWARTTHQEFIAAYAQLREQGAERLVIDLRDNPGGYMQSAIYVANEFLAEGDMVVYSEGRAYPKEEFFADGSGLLQDVPLAVIVNELSASSSEIFAAAMQDHDRAIIVGRRTFGKGLVQQPFFLSDSSEIRLTVARYYTPSGRSIQKKYTLGNSASYQRDIFDRVDAGEIYHLDSSYLQEAPRYETAHGRTVYGEIGILPDYFVPADSSGVNSYYLRLLESGLTPEYAFLFSDSRRAELAQLKTPLEMWDYLRSKHRLVQDFTSFAQTRGITKRPAMLRECSPLLEKLLAAQIAQNFFGETGFYQVFNVDDAAIEVARREILALPPES